MKGASTGGGTGWRDGDAINQTINVVVNGLDDVKDVVNDIVKSVEMVREGITVEASKMSSQTAQLFRDAGISVEEFTRTLNAASLKQFDEMQSTVTSLTDKLNLASVEVQRLNRELENTKSAKGIDILESRIRSMQDDIQVLVERAKDEFNAFLTSIHVNPDEIYDNSFDQIFNKINHGMITSSQAIEEFKAKFEHLLPAGTNVDSGAIYNLQNSIEIMQGSIERLQNGMYGLQSMVEIIMQKGVKVSGTIESAGESAAKSSSAFDVLIEKIKELGNDSDTAYKNVSVLAKALSEMVNGGDTTALYAMQTTFQSMAQIGTEKFSSIGNLAEALKNISETAKGGKDGLQAIANISFKNFSELKTDKRNVENVSTLVTNVGSADVTGLNNLAAIDWSNLNKFEGIKTDKRNIDNITSLVGSVGGANVSGLQNLASIDWSNLNGLKLSKSSIDGIVAISKVSDELNKLKLRVDAFTASQSSMTGTAYSTLQTGMSYDAAAFYNSLPKATSDLGLLKSVSMEAKDGLDQLTKATITYEDEVNKLTTKITDVIDDQGKLTEKQRITTENTKAARVEVEKYVASLTKMLTDIDKQQRAIAVVSGGRNSNNAYVASYTREFENIKVSIANALSSINGGIQGNLDYVDILVSNKNAIDQIAESYRNCSKAASDYISSQKIRLDLQNTINSVKSQMQKLTDANKQGSEEYNTLANSLRILNSIMTQLKTNSEDAGASINLIRRIADVKTSISGTTSAVNEYVKAQNEAAKSEANTEKAILSSAKARLDVQNTINSVKSQMQKLTDANKQGSEEYNTLANSLRILNSIMTQLKTNSEDAGASINLIRRIADVKTSISGTTSAVNEYTKAVKDSRAAEKEESSIALSFQNAKNDIEKMIATLEKSKDVINSGALGSFGGTNSSDLLTNISNISSKLISLRSGLGDTTDAKGLSSLRILLAEINNEIIKLDSETRSYSNARNMANAADKEAYKDQANMFDSLKTYETLLSKVNAALVNFSAAKYGKSSGAYGNLVDQRNALEELKIAYDKGLISQAEFVIGMKEISSNTASAERSIKEAGEATKTLGERLGAAASKFGSWLSVSRVIMRVVSTVRNMVKSSIEIDQAMTQLKIVTGATDAQMEKFAETTIRMSKELGQSVTDVTAAVETFSRLGYTLEEASTLAEYAEILANVANVDVSEATTGMTSIIKGYGMQVSETEHVADVLIEVGQKYAVSASEMMEAYEKSGAALQASGTSFEKSAGLIAAANAAVQNASTVGNALKTVSARIRGSTTDLEELGESTEDLADGLSKYRDEIIALTGFDIMNGNSSFKDMYDIFEGIANVWNDLTNTQQARVSEILGGTRQLQVISSIMVNWKDAANAYASAMNSAGVSVKANAEYMTSVQAHIDQFKASLQELGSTLFQSGDMNAVIDAGRFIVELINSIAELINKIGGLKVVLPVLLSGKILRTGAGLFESLKKSALGFAENITKLSVIFKSFISMASIDGATGILGFKTALAATSTTILSSVIPAIAAGIAAIVGIIKIIDVLNVTYDEQVEKVNELNEAYNKDFGAGSRYDELINKTRELTEEEREELNVLTAIKDAREAELRIAGQKEFEKYQDKYGSNKELLDFVPDASGTTFSSGHYVKSGITQDVADYNQIVDEINSIEEAYKNGYLTYEEYGQKIDGVIGKYGDLYNTLKKYESYDGFSDAQKDTIKILDKASASYAEWKNNMQDALYVAKVNLDNYVNSQIAKGLMMSEITDLPIYKKLYEEYANALNAAAVAGDAVTESTQGMIDRMAELASQKEAIDDIISSSDNGAPLSYENYSALIKASSDYAACIKYENGVLRLDTEQALSLYEAKLQVTKTEAEYKKLLAEDEYKKNQKRIDELVSSLGDLNDEKKDELDSLYESNRTLADGIRYYSSIASEIEYATSAYKKWVDAQDASETGDMYDEMLKAMEQVNDALESGKTGIGNRKYTAAVEMLIPEVERSDVKKYMDTLQRYLTEDSTGAKNFVSDLISNGFADGTVEKAIMRDGVTAQEIADTLKLTPDMVKYIFGELMEYGATDFDMSFFAEDVEDQLVNDLGTIEGINNAIKEYTDLIAQIQSDGSMSDDEKLTKIKEIQANVDYLTSMKGSIIDGESTDESLESVQLSLNNIQESVNSIFNSSIGTLGTGAARDGVNSVISAVNELYALMKNPPAMPSTIIGDMTASEKSEVGNASASGTRSAAGGKTLVNELGAELISENGKAYIANDGKPAIVDLHKGSIVLNAKDTQEALGSKKINSLAAGTGVGDVAQLIEDIRNKLYSFADEYNRSGNGNVDALGRPHISKSRATALGKDPYYSSYWGGFNGDYANTYSRGYVIGEGKNKYSIEVTPILSNGEVLTEEGLEDYVDSLVTGNGINGVISSDKLNLLMNVQPGDWDSQYWDKWFSKMQPVKDDLLETINQLYNIATLVAGKGNEPEFLSGFGINTEGLDEAMLELNEIWGIEIPDKEVDVVANTDNAMNGLKAVQSYQIGDKTFSVSSSTSSAVAKLLQQYEKFTSMAYGNQYASGTTGAKAGKALVNEEGPELISDNGEAYIANGGRPAVVNLSEGAIVLNADDTKDALSQNRKTRMAAYYSGTLPSKPTKTTTKVSYNDVSAETMKQEQLLQKQIEKTANAIAAAEAAAKQIGVNTGSGSSGSGGGGGSSSSEKEETWFEKEYKYHQHLVAMDKETIADYLKWLDDAYKRAYKEGIIELDDYYKYAEEVYQKLQDDFKDYLNDRDFEVDMLKRQEGNTNKIAASYKQLLVDVRTQINEAYASGLKDTDDYVQELWNTWWGYYDDLDDLRTDTTDNAKDAIDELVDYRIKMLKQSLEDEKESYSDRLSLLKDFIDRQKQMLSDSADDEDYLKDQEKKRKAVADIEAEIQQLEYDNSAAANKKKLELQEELIEAQEDLRTFERDHAIEMAGDELDAIYDMAEQSAENQTDAIDKQLENAQVLYERALEDVKNNSKDLYDELVAYELKYGSGTAEAIEEMWTDAYKALETYMDLFGEYYKGIELQNVTGYTKKVIDTTNPAGSSSNYSAPLTLSEARSESSSSTTSTSTSAPSLEKGSYVDVKSGTKWYADSGGGGAWGWASGGTIKYINLNGSHPYNINGAGWIRKEDIVGYAGGTSSATSGLHSFDEDGSEYLFSSSDGNKYKLFNSGDKVLSSKAAQFLYDFANAGLEHLTKGMNSSIGSIHNAGSSASIVMGDIIIQGNADMDTVSEIRRTQRENMDYILKQLNRLNR